MTTESTASQHQTTTPPTIEVIDPADRRQTVSATGLLRTFSEAGVFEPADVHVAQRLTAMAGESDPAVSLAVALVVRALRPARCAST